MASISSSSRSPMIHYNDYSSSEDDCNDTSSTQNVCDDLAIALDEWEASVPSTQNQEEKATRDDGKERVSLAATTNFAAKHKKTAMSPKEEFQGCIKKIKVLIGNHETATVKAVNECMLQFKSAIASMNGPLFNEYPELLETALLLTKAPFKTNDDAIKISTCFFWKLIDVLTKRLASIRRSYTSLCASLTEKEVQAKIERCYYTIITSMTYTRHDTSDDLKRFIDLKRELEDPFYASFQSKSAQKILRHINRFATQSKTFYQKLGGIIARFDELPKPSGTPSRS